MKEKYNQEFHQIITVLILDIDVFKSDGDFAKENDTLIINKRPNRGIMKSEHFYKHFIICETLY